MVKKKNPDGLVWTCWWFVKEEILDDDNFDQQMPFETGQDFIIEENIIEISDSEGDDRPCPSKIQAIKRKHLKNT